MIRLTNKCLGVLVVVIVMGMSMPTLAAETRGKIKSIDAAKNEFVFTDSTAKDWTFQLTKDGKVTVNDKEIKLADLKAGDEATVIYEKKEDKLMATEVKCSRK